MESFEKRALQAENQIKDLTKQLEALQNLAKEKISSLEKENAQLKSQSVQVKVTSTVDESIPKGHTSFSWGSQTPVTIQQQVIQANKDSTGKDSDSLEAISIYKEIKNTGEPNIFRERISVKDVVAREDKGVGLIDQKIVVCGWVKTSRIQGGGRFAFLEINDGSILGNIQVVVDKDVDGFKEASESTTGASFFVQGTLVKGQGQQPVELRAEKCIQLGVCDGSKFPLSKKKHTLEYLRSHAHLRVRTNTIGAVSRVRNALSYATHKFFQSLGFNYVHTPLITASDCEGAGEMFAVTTLFTAPKKGDEKPQARLTKDIPTVKETGLPDYSQDFFGKPTFLTVSGQLNGENYACGLTNIYTFGPTFRAEVSHTTRHLSEFWMIEPEMAFCDLNDNINYAEAFLKFVVKFAIDNCAEDLAFFDKFYENGLVQRLKEVVDTPFVRITYTEAVEKLIESKKEFKEKPVWGGDLSTEHERYLTEQIYKKPTVVTNYPKDFKAFYMRLNEDKKTVAAMDVLVPKVGEIIGGSQREERLDKLEEQIKVRNLSPVGYESYLDLRRFGSVPHSGFGLGFERLVMFTTGIENIRDIIPFPRYPGHAEF
jgi:asparaginyl-tRNA synthetase